MNKPEGPSAASSLEHAMGALPGVLLFLVGLALTSTLAYAQAASTPSFDCRKATTSVEKLICSEPALGDLDRKMDEAFRQVLAEAPVANRQAIINRQLGWLQDRAIGCGLDSRQPAFHTLDSAPPAKCLAEIYERWFKYTVGQLTAAPRPQRTEFPFETTRQPFFPHLLVSRDAKLCDAFVGGLRQDFLARHHGDDEYVFKEPPISLGHWVDWPSEHSARGFGNPAPIDVAELDLDGNGQKQLLLHVTYLFNSRGNSYFLLISSKIATDGLAGEIGNFTDHPLPEDRKSTSIRGVQPYTYGGYIYGYASPVKVLAYQGGMYLYLAKYANFFPVDGARDGTAVLRRIHANGSTELRCEASIAPKAGVSPQRRPIEPPDSLSVPDDAVKWLQTVREIQGNEARNSGTLHALNQVLVSSAVAGYDAFVRPWEVSASRLPPYQPSGAALQSWIREWGYKSLSRYRLARAFENNHRAALNALAKYYEHSFGVPNGQQAASVITDNILSSSFYIPDPDGIADLAMLQQIDEFFADRGNIASRASRLLRSALLIGSPLDMIHRLINADATLEGSNTQGTESPEPAIFYALEHPDEVRLLLDRGADVNEGNAFGKTALMYSAQYDLPDTVTFLLAHGADVTKRTDARNVMDAKIQFDNRTALMYAAENASERVIRELIRAGSDTCATDSGKRDVRDYLSRNRRLSEDERARVAQLIAAKPCDVGSQSNQSR